VSNGANKESLKRIFSGFQTLSKREKIEYLKYLILVIERQSDLSEKNRLIRFKNRLEKLKIIALNC
jgi:hypothetical protein